ncbi:MAG: hypothetical protein ACR2JR_04065 [Rubrobacteraceae bacterium]
MRPLALDGLVDLFPGGRGRAREPAQTSQRQKAQRGRAAEDHIDVGRLAAQVLEGEYSGTEERGSGEQPEAMSGEPVLESPSRSCRDRTTHRRVQGRGCPQRISHYLAVVCDAARPVRSVKERRRLQRATDSEQRQARAEEIQQQGPCPGDQPEPREGGEVERPQQWIRGRDQTLHGSSEWNPRERLHQEDQGHHPHPGGADGGVEYRTRVPHSRPLVNEQDERGRHREVTGERCDVSRQ